MIAWKDPVVVGYDTSKESEFAITWAAGVAQRRSVPLIVLHATGVEQPAVELARVGVMELYQQRAREVAEGGAAKAREVTSTPVTAVGVQGGASAALVEYSRRASLVVVGHRGRSLLAGALLGSDALAVATHAACPVAVIRSSPRPLPSMEHPVVVAVDGSEHSARALDQAALLAADTGSFLRVVVAWRVPEHTQGPAVRVPAHASGESTRLATDDLPPAWGGADARARWHEELAADLSRRAAETARWAAERAHGRYPDLKVEEVVREGRAAQVIVAAAADASLIAVGARGHGDLKALLLGSVSRRVMQRAECAVYVIR